MAKPKRAALYYRISRDRTGEMAGVTRQEHDVRALAAARGWEVAGEFTDDDVSAYTGKPRPAFDRMLAEVVAGRVDVVAAWHPDRLTRHPRELEDLIDALEAARCTVETVRDGSVDLSTRSGRTRARLVGTIARDESEAKAERLQAMHGAKARAGEWPGGPRPFGYRADAGALVVDPAEADVIREAARRALAGESLHAICVDLTTRGVPGAHWHAPLKLTQWRTPTLRRVLTGCTIAGRREHKGEDVGPAQWPAIIDTRTSRRVRAALDGKGPARGRVARVSLLAGVATCGKCGATLATQRRSTGVRVYVCPATSLGGCGGLSIVADPLDDLLGAAVCARVDSPALAAALEPSDDDDQGADDVAELEQALVDLAGDLGAGRITRAEWLAARAPFEARLDAARAAASTSNGAEALRPYAGAPGALTEAWPSMTLDKKRAVLSAVIDRVTILPATRRGPGFDADRVAEPVWKV